MDGVMDVQGGRISAGPQGGDGGWDEHPGGLSGVRPAPGHGAQDDQLLGPSGLPAAETQAAEAQAEAERAAVELQSAQDTLTAAQTLADARRAQTILAIKHEDSIRAIWQQVMEVRLVGLGERTNIWKEAVTRWEAEDLLFSTGMQARIQEVERLQALNLALEQSMADQRRVLITQLEVLEKQEQDQMETREASSDTSQVGTNPESTGGHR